MWISQDRDGWIKKHVVFPRKVHGSWLSDGCDYVQMTYENNVDWENSLINIYTHNYEIKDGILMKLDKAKKPTPRKHAELACKYFMDDTVQIQFRHSGSIWHNTENPEFIDRVEYREKPKTKTVRFRNYLNSDGNVCASYSDSVQDQPFFKEWIGDWQEVAIND